MKIEPFERTPLTFTWRRAGAILASAGVFWLTGCTPLRPSEQRLVAKPNMTFSDSATLVYNSSRLFPQLASGFAAAGGTQNSGCTSCR